MTALRILTGARREPGPAAGWWITVIRSLFPVAAILSLAVGAAGCRVVQAPVKAVSAITPGSKSGQTDPAELENRVERFTDQFTFRTGLALDEYARLRGTPEAASQALRWKLIVLSVSIRFASGPNPYANLVDIVAAVSLNRTALEHYRSQSPEGAAFEPWLQASRALETNAWQLAATVFSRAQVDELRQAIDRYRLEHADTLEPLVASAQDFTSSLKLRTATSSSQPSFLGYVGLDPTMGLDPAVQEVTRTRLFAERAMFTFQRMPALTRLQMEVLVDDLLHRPEMQQTLTNATGLTESAARISQTVAGLPDRISAERQALLAALEDQQGKLGALSAELNRTLISGDKMSTSLNETLITFDAVMKRFGVGEPQTNAVADTNATPFNILDYARTAEQLSVTVRDLDALLKDLGATLDSPGWNARLRDVAVVSRQTTQDAKSVLNHAFLLGAGLIVLAFLGAVVYRRTAPRRRPADRENS